VLQLPVHPCLSPSARSNSEIRWAKARLGRYTVRRRVWLECSFDLRTYQGALNWATGETVAVKEIQLSNIPKGELGQIMVRVSLNCAWLPFLTGCLQSEIDLLKNLNVCTRVYLPVTELILVCTSTPTLSSTRAL
jgi:hypothetical protein